MKVEYNATIQAQVLVMTVVFFKEFMILNPFDYQVLSQKNMVMILNPFDLFLLDRNQVLLKKSNTSLTKMT